MEFQSVENENFQEMNQEDIHDIKIKYNNFYDYIQPQESEQIGSDLDDLQDAFDQEKRCQHQKQNGCNVKSVKRNPRVDEVPTVYLVTCIKTQYIPKKSYWDLYQSETETNQSPQKNNNQNKMSSKSKKWGHNLNDRFLDQDFNQKNLDLTFRNKSKNNFSTRLNQHKFKGQYQREWNTDYITLRFQQFGLKQTQKKKLMHQQIQYCRMKVKKEKNRRKGFQKQGFDQKISMKKILNILDRKQKLNKNLVSQYLYYQSQAFQQFQRKSSKGLRFYYDRSQSKSKSSKKLNKNEFIFQQNSKKQNNRQQQVNSLKQLNLESHRMRNVILLQSCNRIKDLLIKNQADSSSNRSNMKRKRKQRESAENFQKESSINVKEDKKYKNEKMIDQFRQKIKRKFSCGDNGQMEFEN